MAQNVPQDSNIAKKCTRERVYNFENEDYLPCLHGENTLIAHISGPDTQRTNKEVMKSILMGAVGIGATGLKGHYRFGDPHTWYFNLTSAAHLRLYKDLDGKELRLNDPKLTVRIEHKDKERKKGTIHWLPPHISLACVKRMVVDFTGDPNAEVIANEYLSDEFHFRYREQETTDVPHYIKMTLRLLDKNIVSRVWVTLPGRRTECTTCGSDEHWDSQCPVKRRALQRYRPSGPLQSLLDINFIHSNPLPPRPPSPPPRSCPPSPCKSSFPLITTGTPPISSTTQTTHQANSKLTETLTFSEPTEEDMDILNDKFQLISRKRRQTKKTQARIPPKINTKKQQQQKRTLSDSDSSSKSDMMPENCDFLDTFPGKWSDETASLALSEEAARKQDQDTNV
jgi:hypothetical protein